MSEQSISSPSAVVDARPSADRLDWKSGRSETGINHRAAIKVKPGTVDTIDSPVVVEDDMQGYLTEREKMLADEPLWLSIVKIPWELVLMIGRGLARLGVWIFGERRKRHS
ncbi:hypothetical protein HYT05_02185 [Candidatus Kaiserbacteria bacterium]|nr:hypothetical protein [Candidatus Kaiserbacteria bacterium]